MRINFSHHFDGTDWTTREAEAGELRTGPGGMLRILESRLGLATPESHPAERIAAWMKRMEAVNDGRAWFHESFEADRWSTAAKLLGMRDELVMAGWTNHTSDAASVRLAAIAKIESLPEPALPAGAADRMRDVFGELYTLTTEMPEDAIAARVLDIERISLIDEWDHVDPVWKELFERLERTGVTIDGSSARPNTGGHTTPPADIDYHLLSAEDEWEAAEAVATWLAAGEDKENEHVTLLCGEPSSALDAALADRGLPVIGNASPSPWRGALQLLPLFFANVWCPVDVSRLAELLSLDYSPVPRWAARHFLKALEKEPGIGGRAWNQAIRKIAEQSAYYKEQRGEKGAAEAAEYEAGEMHRLLAGERFHPDHGIPGPAVAERCRAVIDRLSRHMESDASARAAVGHARILAKLCEHSDPIPRPMLERMIDSVIGRGVAPEDVYREASPWRVATHPGEITSPTQTVIWWNFTDRGTAAATHWSEIERQALSREGIHPPAAETVHMREGAAWGRPAAAATERLIMVLPRRLRGEDVRAHPWHDELTVAEHARHNRAAQPTPEAASAPRNNINLIRTEAAELFGGPQFHFAGRRAELEMAAPHKRTELDGYYHIDKGAIGRPEHLSYSSMADLLGCPMKWALSNHAHLEQSGSASIPDGNTMIGTLCHRIVELLYADGDGRVEPEIAERHARELFNSLVESMASRLLLPGREVELRRTREVVARAVQRLAEALERFDLTVEACEEFREAELNGVTVRGPADIVARDRNGRAFVIDMKWSGSSRYRREEIERGEALQLAVYSWLLRRVESGTAGAADDQGGPPPVGSAYFMLAQGELLTASDLAGSEALKSPEGEEKTFDRAIRSWEQRLTQMNDGVVEATGLTQADMDADELRGEYQAREELYREPPCKFCDFAWLCGLERDTV